jgi:membrane-associated protein
MALLQGLHGVIAIVLLCGLLFVEEAGVPLPFAPGELTLLAGGLLVASGGLNPFVFVPIAVAASVGGAVVGYSWSRLVGEHGLAAVAARLHQERNLARVSERVRAGGALGIAVSRSIPGLRIYTTLVAGAAAVRLRTFLLGAAPASAAWVVVFVVLGAVVGIPVEHFFSSLERLAVQGAILVAIGVGGYIAVRRRPAEAPGALMRVPYWLRITFAVLLDAAIVASIVAGVLSMARIFASVDLTANWADAAAIVGVIIVFYLIITRRGSGATVGETLFSADYVRRLRRVSPMTRGDAEKPETAGDAAARVFHALGDERRLRVAQTLLDGPRLLTEITSATGITATDGLADLATLQRAGAVRVLRQGGPPRYELDGRVGVAVHDLVGSASTPGDPGALLPSSAAAAPASRS